MITLDPYILEQNSYHQIPVADRWIFNKLSVAEVMGLKCGPAGTFMTSADDVVIRPIMNLAGFGTGGVFRQKIPPGLRNRGDDFIYPAMYPGHFWVEYYSGPVQYVEYVNDVAVASSVGAETDPGYWAFAETATLLPLPEVFTGISHYMTAEFKGGVLIEVTPRHSPGNARQSTIDAHMLLDPEYDATGIPLGLTDMTRVVVPMPGGPPGWRWEHVEESRRAWEMYP